ncbi:LPS assembly lipoprotein LptE [Roseospira goensis]|uniref:LPS-assembly lipoprotein n=1 Tax=Roseospira goensis TaxID=391922 RepID=A0A7W6RZL9_9PROT|nr:LPS assembly lipoprotein LptE [Roseospira goensis]MBB4286001.1 LPS-assembly lipoprotein [Roseospira goensis]
MALAPALPRGRGRSVARRAVLVSAAVGLLAACGFRPMYGRGGAGGPALSSVAVAPIPERFGQLLRNALLDRLRPGPEPRHELQVSLSLLDQDLGVQRDDRATLANLQATATWRLLTRVDDGRQRLDAEGTARAAVTYNILDNQYATEASRRAAQRDMAEHLAADIETRLAALFAGRRGL